MVTIEQNLQISGLTHRHGYQDPLVGMVTQIVTTKELLVVLRLAHKEEKVVIKGQSYLNNSVKRFSRAFKHYHYEQTNQLQTA